jgi:hypothetical protein
MSHIRTTLLCLFIASTIAVVVFSVLPGQGMPALGISDKIEHVVAYALRWTSVSNAKGDNTPACFIADVWNRTGSRSAAIAWTIL